MPASQNHLLTVLREVAEGGETDTPASQRVRSFLRSAGIDPRRDIRDLLVCGANLEAPKGQKLAVVLAGDCVRRRGRRGDRRAEGSELLRCTAGAGNLAAEQSGDRLTMGQAADGALVISNDRGLFDAAVESSRTAGGELPPADRAGAGGGRRARYFARGGDIDGPLSRHRATCAG